MPVPAWLTRRITVVQVLLADLALHLAGQGWTFTVITAALAWLAITSRWQVAALTAKAYNAHARIDTLAGLVATAQATADNAHSDAAAAQSTADNAHSDAAAAQSTANSAQSTANAALPAAGGYISGDLHVNGTLWGTAGVLTIGDKAKFDGDWSVDGYTVALSTAMPATLHCGALAGFTSSDNTAFLAALTQCGPQAFAGSADNNTGEHWATGERSYINDTKTSVDAIHNSLINHGFMAS